MEEVWKDIKDYEGIYQVSNLGRIKRLPHRVKNRFGTCCRKEHYIGYKGTNGYMYVLLHKDNTPSTFLIHRLVAQAFIDNPNNYDCINHKDENPLNNCVNNLEWCNKAYNNNYGTIKQRRSVIMDAHPKTSKVIVCELSDGSKIEYPSARKAAKLLGVSSSTIINRCNGKYDECNGMKFILQIKKGLALYWIKYLYKDIVIMEFWVARDEDGDLFLYNQKPSILKTGVDPWDCFQAPNKEFLVISNELFPEVTFENSPQKVELKLINHDS